MPRLALSFAPLLLLLACAGDGDGERVPLGKADAVGSCVGACGGQSADGNCFCDVQCAAIGDCCADKGEVCGCGDGQPAVCEIVMPTCPDGLVLEEVNGCFGDCVDPATCEPPGAGGACGDGTPALCEIVPPECPDGLVIEVVNHCFGDCVDPVTCQPPA